MRRYTLILLLLCALVSLEPLPGATQQSKTLAIRPKTGELAGQTAYTNSYAILIGVNDYTFLPKDKHLNFAVKDATDLRDILIRSYGFPAENITLLLNEQATRANIEAALSALADDNVKPNDRVLIYFSGHGQTVKLQDGGEMGFLIPYDARVDLAHPENRGGYLATCLRMDSIWGYLEASAAKHRLLLADSCFGGLLVKGKALNGEKPNRAVIASLLARPALQAMSAGAGNEEALEDPKLGHSTYTFKLLEELKAQAATPDSVFLASTLAAALKISVGNLTQSKQTPQFGNYHSTEGDFVFVTTEPHAVSPLPALPVEPAIPSSRDLVRWGKTAEDKKEYAAALALYHDAAIAGDAAGMNGMGRLYTNGTGVEKDDVEAVKWFRKAAAAGELKAMFNLGRMYENGLGLAKDEEEAVNWYRKAAEAGLAGGMSQLGTMYYNGTGVVKDETKAVKWFLKAAEAGDSAGMYNMGVAYINGSGIAKDEPEALKWFHKAAEARGPTGLYNMGMMYSDGSIVTQNEPEAMKWFRKAADAGNAPAMFEIGKKYMNGTGVAKNDMEAVKWYRKAAEAGNDAAKQALTRLGK